MYQWLSLRLVVTSFVVTVSFLTVLYYVYDTQVVTIYNQPRECITSPETRSNTLTGDQQIPAENNQVIHVANRMCTQQERIQHMHKFCDRYSLNTFLQQLPAKRSYIDYNHKLVFCWMSKAGCTSLKAFIMDANGLPINEKSMGDSLNKVHFDSIINKYGVKRMEQIPDEERIKVVNQFYTTFAIRHPFDRIVAYYRDKIVDTDRSSNHPGRSAEILRRYRPELFQNNSLLDEMEFPQTVLGSPTFKEFINWMYETKTYDDHWAFISECCHPCAHKWDAILRIETMETDGMILADRLNVSYSSIPRRHSHEDNPSYNTFSKHLDLFEGANETIIDYLLDMFRLDMDMFGYGWDKDSSSTICAINTVNGTCC